MASRTLASVSGRTIQYSTDMLANSFVTVNPSASRHPRKRIKKLKDDPPPAKTESIYSDDPVPASSSVCSCSIPVYTLEKSLPSIVSIVNLMRALKGPHCIKEQHSLGLVFLSCLHTIVRSMTDLPHGVHLDPRYEVAQYAVMYAGSLLEKEFDRQKNIEDFDATRSHYSATLRLVDTILETLRTFCKVVERLFADNKPWPALPLLFGDTRDTRNTVNEGRNSPGEAKGSVDKVDESLLNVVKDVIRREEELHLSTQDDRNIPQLPRNHPQRRVEGKLADIPILPRRSAIYYLADPYNGEEDVGMPSTTGERVAARFDRKGNVKAASLTALVRMLTAIESVIDQEFIPTFFVCFRFFTTPRHFLEALINRFNEQPPNDYNPLQLEVWVRNRINDHIRIAKTVLLWLELYWKSDVDHDNLPDLQDFVMHHLVFVVPSGLGDAVLEALDLVDGDHPFCRRSRKAHDLKFIYTHGGRIEIPPNDFTVEINPGYPNGKQLLSFDSPSGREEFARQHTIYISEQFRQVDPEDAIKYWYLKEQEACEADAMQAGQILRAIIEFERALCSWVTFSVLDEVSRTDRRIFIEFWLDISARCLRLRNFSGAHCILVGLSNGSITRLKHTVLDVNLSSKQQFRVLQKFFNAHDNYASYREVLYSVEPTVPILALLIRDVVSALSVVPTSIQTDDHSLKSKNMINLCSYRVVLKTVRAMESCLIPYELTKSDDFCVWVEPILERFPSCAEAQLYDNFYVQSKEVEAKDEDLKHIHDPWNFIVRGELVDAYTLHELPSVSSLQKPKKNRLAALFRKV
ncbi:hypothetical protein C0989_009376 [Termitomyces sp. Mn162]|nr:hypothetical protein C0989_009376 [Termitomyces sp. Mn162]